MFHKIARMVKNISFMILSWQGAFLQKRLIKRLGYKKAVVGGCTVDISQELQDRCEKVDNDVRAILKKLKNNPLAVMKYLEEQGVPVYPKKSLKRVLKFLNEKQGLILERSGFEGLIINLAVGNGLRFKSEMVVLLEEDDPDIYNLIYALHKWYARKEGLEGFDKKSQKLLRKFNDKNEDKLIGRLSIPEIEGLKNAIARNVQAIDFISKYSRENEGSKKALERMKQEGGTNI